MSRLISLSPASSERAGVRGFVIASLVHYTGEVQAVGFRMTAVSIARAYPVTGWVRNLSDGRVQLLAEGEESDVRAFLNAVRSYWGDSIEHEQIEAQEPSGRYSQFQLAR
jgi:acylphosphatase